MKPKKPKKPKKTKARKTLSSSSTAHYRREVERIRIAKARHAAEAAIIDAVAELLSPHADWMPAMRNLRNAYEHWTEIE